MLEQSVERLRTIDRTILHNSIFNAFLYAALSTKHKGFREEREWRIVYTDLIHQSTRLIKGVETIRGTPQIVFKLPLQNVPEEELVGIEPHELLHRVIIGPSENVGVIRDAIIHLLEQADIKDAAERVSISGIPLR